MFADLTRRVGDLEKTDQSYMQPPMTVVADKPTGPMSFDITSTSATQITNSSTSFTLSRVAGVLLFGQAKFAVTVGVDFGYGGLRLDGVAVGPQWLTGAGTHTLDLEGHVGAAGTTMNVLRGQVTALRLG
jgi:hypothetical protein